MDGFSTNPKKNLPNKKISKTELAPFRWFLVLVWWEFIEQGNEDVF